MNANSLHRLLFRQRGISLVELMIAITLGLLIMSGLIGIFVNNSRARAETEKASQQVENGRYATQLLLEDLQMAGFYGELNPVVIPVPITMPPNVCADVSATALHPDLALPIQGYHNVSTGTLSACGVADLVVGSDIVVVRRTSSCVAGTAGCAAVDTTKYTYFQTGLCPSDSGSYVVDTDATHFTLTKGAAVGTPSICGTAAAAIANIRAFYTHIYYLANNNVAGDGIPTLKMVELGSGAFNAPVALVEGIQQMQLEYGVANIPSVPTGTYAGDPAAYTVDPGIYSNTSTCGGVGCLPNWMSITAVKVHILARNKQLTAGYLDGKTYVLGQSSFGPFNDAFKRHAYTTLVRLNNVGGRTE